MMAEERSDPTEDIINNMEDIFEGINKHLDKLDNGGYMIEFDKTVVKLENSDIVLKETYIDRLARNVTKIVNPNDVMALTFAFQESVALLKNRNAVDMRILMTHKSQKDPNPSSIGMAEEICLCNPETFACIAIFAIQHIKSWMHHQGKCQKLPRKGRR